MHKKVSDFYKCIFLKNHFQQNHFLYFTQLTALITASKLRSTTFHLLFFLVFLILCFRILLIAFKIFKEIALTVRLVAFLLLVETESSPFYLQMVLVELKDIEQLVTKFKCEERLLETWKSQIDYLLLRELEKKLVFLSEALASASLPFHK